MMWQMKSACLILLAGALPICAQDASRPAPKPFDISIAKPHKLDDESMNMGWRGGSYFAENAPLEILLVNAYGIREGFVLGLKGWETSTRWDVQAKWTDWVAGSAPEMTQEQRLAAQRQLLVALFSLRVHTEKRMIAGYELRVMPGGSRMREHVSAVASREDEERSGTWRSGLGRIDGVGIDTGALITPLERKAGRPIVDRTGLGSHYDVTLRWAEQLDTGPAEEDGVSLPAALKNSSVLNCDRRRFPSMYW
jgi:uncharacterized protein (TIGR03435 family)